MAPVWVGSRVDLPARTTFIGVFYSLPLLPRTMPFIPLHLPSWVPLQQCHLSTPIGSDFLCRWPCLSGAPLISRRPHPALSADHWYWVGFDCQWPLKLCPSRRAVLGVWAWGSGLSLQRPWLQPLLLSCTFLGPSSSCSCGTFSVMVSRTATVV